MSLPWIVPDWPAPARVRALSTTRAGGASRAPYDGLNLGTHVGDDPAAVAENRRRLALELPAEPMWLDQVHGIDVARWQATDVPVVGDAAVATAAARPCAVLTADCLPVLLCDRAGSVVAAAHAGWRGLLAGVLENSLCAMDIPAHRAMAWLGPAIGPAAFEVGPEVRDAFLARDSGCGGAFTESASAGRWMADLYRLAGRRLAAAGVEEVHGGGLCTYAEPRRFYSYRRDGRTGRQATVIWLAGPGG